MTLAGRGRRCGLVRRLGRSVGLLGMFAVPLPLSAQVSGIDLVCGNPELVDVAALPLGATDPLTKIHPTVARERLGPLLDSARRGEVADSLARWFREIAPVEPRPGDGDRLLGQLSALAALLGESAGDSMRAALVVREPAAVVDLNPQPVFGVGYVIFPGTKSEITIGGDTPERVQQAFCWTAYSASDLLGVQRRPALQVLLGRIRTALAAWEAYNRGGRSQYPWELWINGLGSDPREIMPPRTQTILFHPWIGVEAVGLDDARLDDLGSVRRVAVVPLDLIGLIRYNETFSRYWGLSLTLSLGEQSTRGGVSLHLSNGVSFGPTWGEFGAPTGVMFSVDFYHLLAGVPQVQRAAEERLRAAAAD